MKKHFLLFFACLTLFTLNACSLFTVQTAPDTFECSHAVPPIYCVWQDNAPELDDYEVYSLLFPLFYTQKKEPVFLTPLFGYDHTDSSKLNYYLTPLLNTYTSHRVNYYNFFPFSFRHVPADSARKTNDRYALNIWPLWRFNTPAYTADSVYATDYAILDLVFGSVYRRFHSEFVSDHDSEFISRDEYGLLYSKSNRHYISNIQIGHLLANEIGMNAIENHKETRTCIYPFYYTATTSSRAHIADSIFSSTHKRFYFFPFYFDSTTHGERPVLVPGSRRTPVFSSEPIDNKDLVVFPFFSYSKQATKRTTTCLLFLFMKSEDIATQSKSCAMLWSYVHKRTGERKVDAFLWRLFRYERGGDAPSKLHLFFVPVSSLI